MHPTYNDNEDTPIQTANETSQSTQMLPQLMQKMKQIQTLMAQMQTQLHNTNTMVKMKTALVVETRVTR